MSDESLRFGGEETFTVSVDALYQVLSDMERVAAILPDVDSVKRVDEKSAQCVVRPGISVLRGKLTTTLMRVDSTPNEAVSIEIASKGIGVQIKVLAKLRILAEGTDAKLVWEAQVVERTGLVAALSAALIRGVAEQTIRRGWGNLRREVEIQGKS